MSELIKNIFDIKKSESFIRYNKYHVGNIFGITKVSRWELMHSNFIAWALSPNSPHALYYYPLYQLIKTLEFLKENSDNDKARLDIATIHKFYDDNFIVGATVEREVRCGKKSIDILITIKTKEKILPIIIENKVDSRENGENGDQTKAYFEWAESKYHNKSEYYEPIYIFLSPEYNREKPSEERYIHMTYQELVDYIIEPSMIKCGDANSIHNFQIYLQCLSYQSDSEKGGNTMAISSEERKILDDFIDENKELILTVLDYRLKDELDPDTVTEIKTIITGAVRDYSKYQFNGGQYAKNRLVLAVVKKYVEEYPDVDFATLQTKFYKELQGSIGVVRSLEAVMDPNRFFVKPDEIITLRTGESVVVCNQWGLGNIENFIKHVIDTIGYKITKI